MHGGVRREADAVRARLLRYGVAGQTIEGLSEQVVGKAVKALRRFCDAFGPVTECV